MCALVRTLHQHQLPSPLASILVGWISCLCCFCGREVAGCPRVCEGRGPPGVVCVGPVSTPKMHITTGVVPVVTALCGTCGKVLAGAWLLESLSVMSVALAGIQWCTYALYALQSTAWPGHVGCVISAGVSMPPRIEPCSRQCRLTSCAGHVVSQLTKFATPLPGMTVWWLALPATDVGHTHVAAASDFCSVAGVCCFSHHTSS